jgi:ribosome-associated toxin RatA of RatAB toxin-antitoxin module
MPTGSTTLHARPDEVFTVLADYQRYVDWAPDVVASTLLASEGDIVVAEFRSPFLLDDKYVIECLHSKPHTITYKQVDQYGSRGVQGSWRLEAQGSGETRVTAHMDYRDTLWNRGASRRRAQRILDRRLDSLASRFAGGDPRALKDADRSGLLEALAAGEAFSVWAPGARYLLKKVER